MKILFADVETSGLLDFKLPADDPTQPRMIQIAWMLHDDETRAEVPLSGGSTLIKPDGWTMPADLVEKMGHGYTTDVLTERGITVAEALAPFIVDHDRADLLVGFSFSYDLKIVRGEFRRLKIDDRYGAKPRVDVMYACAPACKAHPGYGGKKKMPKLIEAHELLIGEPYPGAHDAYNDMQATARLYYWLRDNGHPIETKQDTSTRDSASAA